MVMLRQPSKTWVRIKAAGCPGVKQPDEWGMSEMDGGQVCQAIAWNREGDSK